MPTPLWLALFFISAVVFALILGFADSGERGCKRCSWAPSSP